MHVFLFKWIGLGYTENLHMYVKTKSIDTITVDDVYDFDLVTFFF